MSSPVVAQDGQPEHPPRKKRGQQTDDRLLGQPPRASNPLQTSTSDSNHTITLHIPKQRAAGQAVSQRSSSASLHAEYGRKPADAAEYDSLTRSPILTSERDTGLRRIRQVPNSILPRNASSPNLQPKSPALSLASTRKESFSMLSTGPSSPTFPHGEDLTRFPSESLHSFSFAHQSSDSLHSRQNVLKRSIEFMRDRWGWATTSPRIASAQARLAGDEEMLSMMELLQQANLINSDFGSGGLRIDHGPLTGPAHVGTENVFDRSFMLPELREQNESPISLAATGEESTTNEASSGATPSSLVAEPTSIQPVVTETETPSLSTTLSPTTENMLDTFSAQRPQKHSLKRTFTDVAGYSLQHRLAEAMAKPYRATDSSQIPAPVAKPGGLPHTPAVTLQAPPRANSLNERAPHGHRNAQAQAIFTTEARTPWTIMAANDLACLIFGVTRAEVRKLGIMEVIKEDRRAWLEEKLRNPDAGSVPKQSRQQAAASRPPRASPPTSSLPPKLAGLGNGVTAKLLSKPPARETYRSRRSKTENGNVTPQKDLHHTSNRSRGVLLCGDVVPIRKMNGELGSASLWVKEKSGNLIWVLEEITEDVAFLTVDEIGLVSRGSGDVEPIFGLERVRNGMDVQRLIPSFPKLAGTHTGAVDYDAIRNLRTFTARTINAISIPITVEQEADSNQFRISSFPHIAGIVVVNPTTLTVRSSNSVFSAALFGYDNPDGMPVVDLIPGFDKILRVMTDEDQIALVDGIVIPEHSFRRARSLLALREGAADAAAIFLRPSGLPARHRDGAEIMIDLQMRVVKSDREPIYSDNAIQEDSEVPAFESEVVLALWITYSRQLHAVNHGTGPVSSHISRPNTPPRQPLPQPADVTPASTPRHEEASFDARLSPRTRAAELQKAAEEQISRECSPSPGEGEPFEHPSPELIEAGVKVIKKKRIDDFVILEEMGQGAYGQVKLARYKKAASNKMVIKYVTKRRILVDTWHRDRRLGTVPLEIHVLDYLRREGMQHPNIVEMADFFEDDINYYIEMLPHGLPGMDLFDYIELRVTMEEKECRKIFCQVASALQHLHIQAKVVHRDIKDENIILDGEGRVKLADFGSAAYIKNGPFDVFVGTIDYAAPEVLRGSPYRGKEQDVWALGILLYTIVYKENPFYSIDEIMDQDLRVPFILSEECIDLIRKMLDRDVERRIGIQDVVDHPWCRMNADDDDDASFTGR